jgi:hypothetical protein
LAPWSVARVTTAAGSQAVSARTRFIDSDRFRQDLDDPPSQMYVLSVDSSLNRSVLARARFADGTLLPGQYGAPAPRPSLARR